jgi:mercuric ion binding protein
MKRTTMIISAGLALGAAGIASAGLLLRSPPPPEASKPAAAALHATFAIENMTCATCPITVRRAMGRVDGVSSVSVDFEAKTARVAFGPSTTIAAIAAASTNAGYPARSIP